LAQEEARRAYRESRRRAADSTAGTAVRSFEHSVLRFESGVRFEGDQWDPVARLDRAVLRHQRILAHFDPVFVQLRIRQILATFAAKRFGRIAHLSGDWINAASEVFGPGSAEVTAIRQCQLFVRAASGNKARHREVADERLGPNLLRAVPALRRLGARYRKAGLWTESVALRTRFIKRLAGEYGEDHDTVLDLWTDLAFDHVYEGELDRAILLFARLAARRAAQEPDGLDPIGEALRIQVQLAFAYVCTQRASEAEKILVPIAARLKEARSGAPRIPQTIGDRELRVEDLLGRSQWLRGNREAAQQHFHRAYLLAPARGSKADREICFNSWIYSLEQP
jgi:tetratricopeptide (TPR) repeat protein